MSVSGSMHGETEAVCVCVCAFDSCVWYGLYTFTVSKLPIALHFKTELLESVWVDVSGTVHAYVMLSR